MKRILLIIMVAALFLPFVSGQSRSRKALLQIIQLPHPNLTGPVSFEQALAKRRNVRDFSPQSLSYQQLGQIAWAGQGVTEKESGLRTIPSVGSIYPMTLYFATEHGLFVYNPQNHTLVETSSKDIRADLSKAALTQNFVADAACSIIIAGSIKNVSVRYGKKARTFTALEAGHIAQNILLQATALDLATAPVSVFNTGSVRRLCRMAMDLEPFYIIPIGYPAAPPIEKENKTAVENPQIKNKKVALIIPSSRFQDEELFKTSKMFEDNGVKTIIASSRTGTIRGVLGGKVQVEHVISEIDAGDYDAIIFIGGSGSREYFNNPMAHNIAKNAKEQGKILAAIGIAPTILANAGLLQDVRVTVFRSQKLQLRKSGAEFVEAKVQKDGLIITATGPEAVVQFGETIIDTLKSN